MGMPALQPEKFPILLQRAYEEVEYLYIKGLTYEVVLKHLERLQRFARSLMMSAPDGEAHEAAKRFLDITKKIPTLYQKLTDSYNTTRTHQFDTLGTALDAITKAVPEARAASLRVRVARVHRTLSELQ